ncbi:MAG: BMP family ABC transporter substrate-binding protein [Desulfovibrio sp.]|nr:BMP family ABC transporter substrate-binding protein [Desulfovibrio sp.]
MRTRFGKGFKRWQLPVLFGIGVILLASLIGSILLFEPDPEESRPKIGLIILGDINQPGWNASHYQGLREACDTLKLELLVRDKVPEWSGQCPERIRELVSEGCSMIFLCSYAYAAEAIETVEAFPHIAFAAISSEVHAHNMASYFLRIYQARYLEGILAAMSSKNHVLGYITAMPNAEVNRSLNAFALGAQSVDPNVRVIAAFMGSWNDSKKEETFVRRMVLECGCDIFSYHQDDSTVAKVALSEGIDVVGFNTRFDDANDHLLTSIVCQWNTFYFDIIRRFMKGEFNAFRNNWLGMDQGAVGFSGFSRRVSPEIRAHLKQVKNQLEHNSKLIFRGPIYDREGNLRCEEGEIVSEDVLLERLDWQVKGVEIFE